jgi:serine/threonine-protein kinase
MGSVYLAQDERLGRKVALKILFDDVTRGDDWVRRFEQEARATSSLNHPNIITIYEVGQADGSHFISAEFIDGRTLRQHLNENMLSLSEVLDIAIQVATALMTAHEAGIVHRDIKPENVMLRVDGYVKVVDFGLAKFIEKRLLGLSASDPDAETQQHAEPIVKTNPGSVMGTVSYMSPEQARGTHVDARSDIFSLGILLYEMLTGRQPFEGTSASEIVIAIIQKRPKPMARFAPDVPIEMERIVGKALSKSREERYQTIKDLLIDLKRLKRGLDFEEVSEDEPEQELSRQLLSGSTGGVRLSREAAARVSSEQTVAHTNEISMPPTASSAEYIVKGIKQHKKAIFIALGSIVVAIAAFYYFTSSRSIDSIAVLPFNIVNGKPGTEQVSDELTEQIINGFTRMPNIRVMSFPAVAQYKGQQPNPQQVGGQLGVRAILTGSITNTDDAITVRYSLVNVSDGSSIWGDRITKNFSDILLVPEQIVTDVASKIGLKLSAEDEKKREADSLYTKGRNAWNKRTAEAIKEAMVFFNQALNLDPNSARAYAGLADSYNMLATYGASAPTDAFPKANDAATRALALDNNLAEGHAALAYAKFRGEWNWRKAEEEFKEAIRLNDKNASAHQWYATYLAAMHRFDRALEETTRTQELDKTSLIISSHFGLTYFFAGRFDDAIAACKKTVELDPNFFVARRYMGLAYAQKGMFKEALEQYDKALAGSKNSPLMRVERASVLALAGESDKARAELKEIEEMAKQRYISAYPIATIYAALKDRDRAIEWLEKAYTERADWMVFLNVDPRWNGIKSDPRFVDLLRRMNLV